MKFQLASAGALALCTVLGCLPAQAQVQRSFVNTSFERPTLASNGCWAYLNQDKVPGWRTTHPSDNEGGSCPIPPAQPGPIIEMWRTPLENVSAPDGQQVAELNARVASRLYQSICIMTGEKVTWSLYHRGRNEASTANIIAGPLGGGQRVAQIRTTTAGAATVVSQDHGTATGQTRNGWGFYSGEFNYGGPGGITSIGFEAVGGGTYGNLLDGVAISVRPLVDFTGTRSQGLEGNTTHGIINGPEMRISGTVGPAGMDVLVRITGGTANGPGAGSGTPQHFSTEDGTDLIKVHIPEGEYVSEVFDVPLTVIGNTDIESNRTIDFEIVPPGTDGSYVLGSNTNCSPQADTRWVYTILDDDSDLSVSKSMARMRPVVDGNGNPLLDQFDIDYTITVRAAGDDFTFNVVDTQSFEADATVNGVMALSCTRSHPDPGDPDAPPDLDDPSNTNCDGTVLAAPDNTGGPWELNTMHTLLEGHTETYRLTVRTTLKPGTAGSDTCNGSPGSGLYNAVKLTRDNNETVEAEDCRTTPTPVWLRLSKNVAGRVLPSDQFLIFVDVGGRPNEVTTNGTGTGPDQAVIGRMAVPAGSLLGIGENIMVNGSPDVDGLRNRYATHLACTNATAGSPTAPPSGPGTHHHDAGVDEWPAFRGTAGDDLDCVITNTPDAPALSLRKTADGGPWVVGQGGTYTFAVGNGGSGSSSGEIIVVDDLPSQLVPGWAEGTTHTDGDWSCIYSGQRITCTSTSTVVLAVGDEISFAVPVSATASGNATNQAVVGGGRDPAFGDPPDPSLCPAEPAAGDPHCSSATVRIHTAAAITTRKALSHVNGEAVEEGARVKAGDVLRYTITSINAGETAGSTDLTEHVPAGTTYTAGDSPAWSCIGTAAGDACTQTQNVAAQDQASSTFTVTVEVPATEDHIGNAVTSSADTACVSCATSNPVDLPRISLAKTVGSSPMDVGQANSYTLTVTNSGTAANSQPIEIRDTMPDTLAIGEPPEGCVLDPADSQTVVCTVAADVLAGGAQQSFVIPVTPTPAAKGSITNNATASGGGGMPGACDGAGDCAASVETPMKSMPPPAAVPVDARWMLVLLSVLLLGAAWRLRR